MMRAYQTSADTAAPISVRDRILGDTYGSRDEALVFAASSIIKEITTGYQGATVEREVTTDQGSYVLQGSRVHTPDGIHPVVIVFAQPAMRLDRPLAAPVPVPDEIRVRFNLTRKESRVAVLLAAQKSNEQIAADLCISPHTARHHTQSVLSKLGLKSRRDVSATLARGHA
jgi:DNA-binding CsgD family transcriptional regulator